MSGHIIPQNSSIKLPLTLINTNLIIPLIKPFKTLFSQYFQPIIKISLHINNLTNSFLRFFFLFLHNNLFLHLNLTSLIINLLMYYFLSLRHNHLIQYLNQSHFLINFLPFSLHLINSLSCIIKPCILTILQLLQHIPNIFFSHLDILLVVNRMIFLFIMIFCTLNQSKIIIPTCFYLT